MRSKILIFACLVLLGVVMALLYVMLTGTVPGPAMRRPVPPRRKRGETFRVFERRPSGGLVWSKAQYPDQYKPSNVKTVELAGLDAYADERFMDVGGRAYSGPFLEKFSYTDSRARRPSVKLEYLGRAETFAGKVAATGLKPNFAYQIKLCANYAEDPQGFERIGYTGRWRLPGRATNYKDEAYEEYEHKERVEAYLLFDFFVTDSGGNAEKEFYADSSLHVLWNASTQRAPGFADSSPIPVTRAASDRALYANPRPDLAAQHVYAESEQHALGRDNRKPIGCVFLPPGRYKGNVVLTEESFHGFGDAGYWATVMCAPVAFEVVEQPRPKPPDETARLTGSPLALDRAEAVNIEAGIHTAERLEGTAITGDPQTVFGEELEFSIGERHVFAAEIAVNDTHTFQIFIDAGEGFGAGRHRTVTTSGEKGWHRFEVEITSMVEGCKARLRLDPATREGFIGVRNAGIYKIGE